MKERDRPAPRGSRWYGQVLVLAALSCPGRASADDLVVALWLRPGAQDPRLAQRVRGQVSDLPVRLVEAQEPGADTSFGEQLAAADALARRQGARAVVWFALLDPRAPRSGLLVIVAEAAEGRVLVRRVEPEAPSAAGAPADLDSATLEAAALIVRTALRGLAEGAVIGLDRAAIAPAPPAPALPAPAPAPPAPPPRPPAQQPLPAPAAEGSWIAAVGWHTAYDGQALQQGLAGQVGHAFGRWTVGLSVATSLGVELVDPRATLHLARDAFGAFGEITALRTEQVSLGVGLSAGAILFPRSTGMTAAGVEPTSAAANPTFFAGLDARVRWLPRWLGGFAGAWIDAGVDAVPAAPMLGYEVAGQFVPTRSLWPAQPEGALGLFVRTP